MSDNYYDEVSGDDQHEKDRLLSSTERGLASAARQPALPAVLTSLYAKIDESFVAIDAAIKAAERLGQKAKGSKTLDELEALRGEVKAAISEIQSAKIKQTNTLIANLGKQQQVLAASKKLTPEQANLVGVKVKQYSTMSSSKFSLCGEIGTRLSKILLAAENTLRAALHTDEGANDPERAQQDALAQRMELMDIQAQEEEEDIRQVHKDVNEIVGIMHVMADEVQQQQDTIDVIEANVVDADENVEKGVGDLKKAQKHQKCTKKCLIIAGVLGGIAAIILISVVASIFKS